MTDKQSEKEGILVNAAKALGSVAGKIVTLAKHPAGHIEEAGGTANPQSAPSGRAKFVSHTKSRLPRKLKKTNKKLAAKKASAVV